MEFDKPIGQWIEEEVEVPIWKVEADRKGNAQKVSLGTEKRKVKTIYSEARPEKFSCKQGEHDWRITDKHKHIISCKNCTKNRFFRPAFAKLEGGHLLDRETDQVVD